MGSSIYESPTQPTVRLKSPTKFTAANWWNYPELTFPYRRATKRTANRQIWPMQISSNEYSYWNNSLCWLKLSSQSYTSPIL